VFAVYLVYLLVIVSMGNTCTSTAGAGAGAGIGGGAGTDYPSSLTPGATTKLTAIERQQQREREAGQQQLREMVAAADREGMALDWSLLIKKAAELHHRDQVFERKRQRMLSKSRSEDRGYRKRLRRMRRSKNGCSSTVSGGTGDYGNGPGSVSARFQQTIERRRRRRLEACGSFSVNLTIYRNETELPLLHNDFLCSGSQAATSTAESLEDTAPGLSSSMDEETGCAGSLDSSAGLSDGFHISTNIGEELETIQE
jgi:hypothetical protein